MSRWFEMSVVVTKFKPERRVEIQEKAEQEWPGFETADWVIDHDGPRRDAQPLKLTNHAEGSLTGGEDEEHFARRLAAAIMHGNEGPCEVEVTATCMEDLPFERFVLTDVDFEALKTLWPLPDEDD